MIIQIYQLTRFTRSVLSASLVAEIDVDKFPSDLDEFVDQYGGDFIQIKEEE